MRRLIYAALIATIGIACEPEGAENNRAEYVGVNIAYASMTELGYAAAIIKEVIDYNDYLAIESSDAEQSIKQSAWKALGYKSRTVNGDKHILITAATSGNNGATTTILLDAVGLDAGGKWTVERTGYKPYVMEITGNNGEAGRYAVRFESITVGDGFGKEHHGSAHFDAKRNEQRDKLFIEGKISSIHRDKSEYYPLSLTTETTTPLCVNISRECFTEGSTKIVCTDQYYHTADNVRMTILPDINELNGIHTVEVERNGNRIEIERLFKLWR